MPNELWDLSSVVERMAVAMWAQEAWRAGSYSVSRGRTIEAFRNEASETRDKWLGFAGAGLEALFEITQKEGME